MRVGILVAIGLILMAVCYRGTLNLSNPQGKGAATAPQRVRKNSEVPVNLNQPRSLPIHIPQSFPRIDTSDNQAEFIRLSKLIWPSRGSDVSTVLHALHTFHSFPSLRPENGPSVDEMKTLLLDHRVANTWYGASYPIVNSHVGLSYVKPRGAEVAGQSHVDQALATLAELGVASDEQVFTPNGESKVAELLINASSTFQLRGEFEWSAIIRILYFPECREWQNRFGERFDFDLVANALMAKSLTSSACSGTHSLSALALLLRVNAIFNMLSDDVEHRTHDYLRRMSAYIQSQQLEDGSINPNWHVTIKSQPWYISSVRDSGGAPIIREQWEHALALNRDFFVDDMSKLLATTHHVEWIAYLPEHKQPNRRFFKHAYGFLAEKLKSLDKSLVERFYCPSSHGLRVLLHLSYTDLGRHSDVTTTLGSF